MNLHKFEFDVDAEIEKLGLAVANPANSANPAVEISNFSNISREGPRIQEKIRFNNFKIAVDSKLLTPCGLPANPANSANEDESQFHFQERASIREYDGNQSRVEAELGAIDDVLPYLKNGNELNIPFNTPEKYRWWAGGQSLEKTLKELGAGEETIQKYGSSSIICSPEHDLPEGF